ncbi:ABC transporter substrate-binding protein [Paenibacillus alkalitolerans]|uniref:ABC transporter substrate-binding protein n=1 Tax=Paenibacillus alkalitolerans TaxID=2799335 RepID=UPI0018F627E2|nr:ABC transporter substrate-binding protein [Paenibacillus alkalitolerans]
MKVKRLSILLILVLALTMVLSACQGNGNGDGGTANSETNSTENSSETEEAKDEESGGLEYQELKMVLLGGKPADFDTVWAEVNNKFKEKINATVNVQFLDWSDWTQRYPLMFAANDDFDLVYTANWAFYSDQALKGGFLELTDDMIQQYAPQVWADMPEVAWGQAKVKGKLYMVPNNNQREYLSKLVMIRDDLRAKYNLSPVTDSASLKDYLITVAQKEKDLIAFKSSPPGKGQFNALDEVLLLGENNWRLVDPTLPLAYNIEDPKGQLFNIYETPEFQQLMIYYKELAEQGVWSKDILNNKFDAWNDFKAGTNAMLTHNLGTLGSNMEIIRKDYTQFEVALADVTPDAKRAVAVSTQNGMAIHATSKKWERALMVIDLLHSDREIHDLTMYGIADKHYIPVGDDKMKPGPDKANYGISSWGWNSPLNRQNEGHPQDALDLEKKWADQLYHWPLETFVFDISEIKTEASNIAQAMIRYGAPLEYGLIDDLDKGRKDLISQVKAAGLDKVQQIAQKQIDDFLAAQP